MRTSIVSGLLAFLLAVSLWAAPQRSGAGDPRVIDAAGYQKLLDGYRGQPLLVTFWATWCEPCRDEYPMINELAKRYSPQGLRVIGISLDEDGDLILMRRFLARYQPVFPNYRMKGGRGTSAFAQKVNSEWTGAIPASFMYSADGSQVGLMVGANSRQVYEAALRKLLSTRAQGSSVPAK